MILQFGTGRFLRGFFAPIVPTKKSIVVVQSLEKSKGAAQINLQPNGFHVWTRGVQNRTTIDEFCRVQSYQRALVATAMWEQLKSIATNIDLNLIVSNTTAAGLSLSASDNVIDVSSDCPTSFPARLALLLYCRFREGLPGITLLPLELVNDNASTLKARIVEQVNRWTLPDTEKFIGWLTEQNQWLNNIADRIVVSVVAETPPWGEPDPLAVMTEPFSKLAIEASASCPPSVLQHETILWVDDLATYSQRKIRILNGLHTAMAGKFLPKGQSTVLQCMTTQHSRTWIDALLYEEILPTFDTTPSEASAFAAEVMERFENPFFEHQLSDIAIGHETKLSVRIKPTFDAFQSKFKSVPPRLAEVLETNHVGISR